MILTSSGSAFQATDFQRKHREILDQARNGIALIRDKDGLILQMGSVLAVQQSEYQRKILIDLLRVQKALQLPRENRSPSFYGALGWISVLDDEDQSEFVNEIADQIFVSENSGDISNLELLIDDWKATALSWADTEVRNELLAEESEPLPKRSLKIRN